MANLFDEVPSTGSKYQGAPKLQPKGTGSITDGSSTIVDILNDYAWTLSPKSARNNIPIIEFEEYQLDLSSLITSALYKLRGVVSNLNALATNSTANTAGISTTGANPIESVISNTASDAMNPYSGMYVATPTGFKYSAPYLEGLYHNITQQWSNVSNDNTMQSSLGQKVGDIASKITNIVNMTNMANIIAPGSYSETPKFFNPAQPEQYEISFPLLNTVHVDDIVKNWELCYLLTYQNLPNRRSINLLDPPCFYKVTIPGIRQSPAAWISQLQIMHVGKIQNMTINGMIKPVPEAYMVKITFTDMLINSRNIFKYAYDDQQVSATVLPPSSTSSTSSSTTPGS